MKIPCDRKFENAFLRGDALTSRLLDPKTVRRLVKKYGTPLLIGQKAKLRDQILRLQKGLPDVDLCYAMKANSDRTVLTIMQEMGIGFDFASAGEFERIDRISYGKGSFASPLVFSNPCKTSESIKKAYESGCRFFVFDCESEFQKLCMLPEDARLLLRIHVPSQSCCVNLSQRFGATFDQTISLGRIARAQNRNIAGIAFHVGSQATDVADFKYAFSLAATTVKCLRELGHRIEFGNMGGGFPANYERFNVSNVGMPSITGCDPPDGDSLEVYLQTLMKFREEFFKTGGGIPQSVPTLSHPEQTIEEKKVVTEQTELPNMSAQGAQSLRWIAEPGRIIVAEAVTLITKVIGIKESSLSNVPVYTVDDGIYGSFSGRYFPSDHFRFYANSSAERLFDGNSGVKSIVCGPTCDGGDILGERQMLPKLKIGSLLQVPMMGAYTGVGACRFNGMPIAKRIWI